MNRDAAYIKHILECIEKITNYVSEGYESYVASSLIQDAVTRNFEAIGEASNKLSDTFKESHPEIPWRSIIGARNVLIHDYMEVDHNIIWTTIITDLPALKKQLNSTVK